MWLRGYKPWPARVRGRCAMEVAKEVAREVAREVAQREVEGAVLAFREIEVAVQ